MAGWHHRLDGYGFEWTLGVGDGQGDLACCGSWGRKESDTTERQTEPNHKLWCKPCQVLSRVNHSICGSDQLTQKQTWGESAPNSGTVCAFDCACEWPQLGDLQGHETQKWGQEQGRDTAGLC